MHAPAIEVATPPTTTASGTGAAPADPAPGASFAAMLGHALADGTPSTASPGRPLGAKKPLAPTAEDTSNLDALAAALAGLVAQVAQGAPDPNQAMRDLLQAMENEASASPLGPLSNAVGEGGPSPSPSRATLERGPGGEAELLQVLEDLAAGVAGPTDALGRASGAANGLSPRLFDRVRAALLAGAVGGVTLTVSSGDGPSADVVEIGRGLTPGPSPALLERGAETTAEREAASPSSVLLERGAETAAKTGAASSSSRLPETAAVREADSPSPTLLERGPGGESLAASGVAGTTASREIVTVAVPGGTSSAVGASALLDQIAMQARLAVDHGRGEVRLQLQPEALGRLDVRLSYDGSAVTVRVGAENAEVGNLLQANLGQLTSAFESRGIKTDQITVFVASGMMGGGAQAGDPRYRPADGGDARGGSARRIEAIGATGADGPEMAGAVAVQRSRGLPNALLDVWA